MTSPRRQKSLTSSAIDTSNDFSMPLDFCFQHLESFAGKQRHKLEHRALFVLDYCIFKHCAKSFNVIFASFVSFCYRCSKGTTT